jgi:hypothetical protein
MRGVPVFLGAVLILGAGLALSVVVDGRALASVIGGESRSVSLTETPASSYTPTPKVDVSATPVASTVPSPTVSPSASAVPSASPSPSRATTNGVVHLRVGPSVNTDVMTDVPSGTVVTLGAYSDSSWQQVTYKGFNGYIFKSYLNY